MFRAGSLQFLKGRVLGALEKEELNDLSISKDWYRAQVPNTYQVQGLSMPLLGGASPLSLNYNPVTPVQHSCMCIILALQGTAIFLHNFAGVSRYEHCNSPIDYRSE